MSRDLFESFDGSGKKFFKTKTKISDSAFSKLSFKSSKDMEKQFDQGLNDIMNQTNKLIDVGNELDVKLDESFYKCNNHHSCSELPVKKIKKIKTIRLKVPQRSTSTITLKKTISTNRNHSVSYGIENGSTRSSNTKELLSPTRGTFYCSNYKSKRALSQSDRYTEIKNLINKSLTKSVLLDKIMLRYSNKNAHKKKRNKEKEKELPALKRIKPDKLEKVRLLKNSNANIICREETANLIDYGDCHYKLNSMLCYHNKKNIIEKYNILREKANLDDNKKEKSEKAYSNRIEANNHIITRLFIDNNHQYKKIINKL